MSMKPGRNGRGNLIHLILFFRFENGKSLFNPGASVMSHTLTLPLEGEVRWGWEKAILDRGSSK
jgi:hypothetical protein